MAMVSQRSRHPPGLSPEIGRVRFDAITSLADMQAPTEQESHLRSLTHLHRAIWDLNQLLSQKEMAELAVKAACLMARGQASALYLDQGQRGELVEVAGWPPGADGSSPASAVLGQAARAVAETQRPLSIANTSRDPRFPRGNTPPPPDPQSLLCLPLLEGERLIGALVVYSPHPHHFSQYELTLLSILAQSLSSALGRADVMKHLAQQQHSLRQLASRSIRSQENERKKVALEIHDVISQSLTALFYRIQTCQGWLRRDGSRDIGRAQRELADMEKIARNTLDDVTRLMFNLRPPILDRLGVISALRRYIDQFQHENGIRVKLEASGQRKRLHCELELAIYRIVQESLANIRKHSRATRVLVSINADSERIRGRIVDDGVGFDPGIVAGKNGNGSHLGLVGMRERASYFQGMVDISSAPGKGTTISFEMPVLPRKKPERRQSNG
jgi:signal transduction histidine kinase